MLDRERGILVGATAVGPHGGEVLGLLGASVHAQIPAQTLRSMIYAFPTFNGAVGEALGAYARGNREGAGPELRAGRCLDRGK